MKQVYVILMGIILGLLVRHLLNKVTRMSAFKNNTYKKVVDVRNTNDVLKHFVLDNPGQDGSDPTGGNVDYSYLFPKDKDNNLKKNVNGDLSWSQIEKNDRVLECFKDTNNGFILGISKNLNNGKVGSFRLSTKKLFRGGLFIADVEHVPIGCGVWPAFWLNGFVGGKDQYHMSPDNFNYKESMNKLVKYTLGTTENFNHTCRQEESLSGYKDDFMSDFLGKAVYPGSWPLGGEIDIIEQTNFSDTNLISIHGGPKCEVSSAIETNFMADWLSPQHKNFGLRSVCGNTYDGYGPYSGCKGKEYSYSKDESAPTTTINGVTRDNCPEVSATSAGNSQVNGPYGSFGESFNNSKGGIYAVQWVPKEKINVWFYPRQLFNDNFLKKDGYPLSNNPDPNMWLNEEYPNTNISSRKEKYKTLIVSYILNNPNAMTEGCDFNFQALIINITLGGGWGGAVMPSYCSFNNKTFNSNTYGEFINQCFNEDIKNTDSKGVGVKTGCYDGARSAEYRGKNSNPVFFSEAYFKFKSIKIFQNSQTDDNVW